MTQSRADVIFLLYLEEITKISSTFSGIRAKVIELRTPNKKISALGRTDNGPPANVKEEEAIIGDSNP